MLINGLPGELVNANDRGLMYGDGVFRTMLVRNGQIQHWTLHYAKLQHDCNVLKINCPSMQLLTAELNQLRSAQPDGIAKIVLGVF